MRSDRPTPRSRPRVVHAALLGGFIFGALSASPAGAQQQFEKVFPLSFDFSGIWVVEAVPAPSGEQLLNRCDRRWFAESNWPLFGRTWFELTATETEYQAETGVGPKIRVHHQGTLHFFQGYASVDATQNGATYDYYCHLEQIDYQLSGDFEWFPDLGSYNFSLAGTEIGLSPYDHATDASLGVTVFLNYDGTLALGGVGPGEARVNPGVVPGDCSVVLKRPFSEFSLTQCLPRSGYPMIFQRGNSAPDLTPKAIISGTLLEGLPDGTETGQVVTEGRVRLLKQPEAIRPQRGNETAVAYQAYLEAMRAERKLLAETRPDANGRFELPEVDILEKVPDGRRTAMRRAIYTLEVSGGEREEVDAQTQERSTIYFFVKELEGVKAGDDRRVVLLPASDLNAKISLTDRLLALAPNQYGPIEEQVKAYLTQLLTNTVPLTPARNEGVRRAVWAERSVAIGAEFANELTQLMMDNLADWLVDLFGDPISTKSGALKDAEERLSNLKEARDFAAAEGKGLSAFTPFSNSAGVQQLTGSMDELMAETPLLREGQEWDMVKKIFRWGLFYPMKNGLITLGLEPDSVESLINVMEQGVFTVLDTIIQGERGDVYKTVIKMGISRLQGAVFDASFDLIPSYTRLTKGGLENARDRMQSWPSVNDTIYQQDRAICVDHIRNMSQEATNWLSATYFAKGIAEGLGDGADVLSMIPNPAAQTAAKLAKFAKNVAAVDAFVSPGLFTFGRLTGQSDLSAYAAFGMVPPASLVTLPVTATRTAPNPRIHAEFSSAGRALGGVLDQIRMAIARDDYPAAMLLTAGETPQGLLGAAAAQERGFNWLMLVAASSGTDSPDIDGSARMGGLRYLELRAELAVLLTELRGLYLDAMEGQDIARTVRLQAITSRIQSIKNRQLLAERPFYPLYGALNTIQVIPAVAIEDLRLASSTSGRRAITETPESFDLTARVHNLSTAAVGGVSARLRVYTPSGTATITGARIAAVGELAADDGTDGSGGDEATISFAFTYGGPIDTLETLSLELALLESGGVPRGFIGETRSELVTIAPELRDPDADGIPTPVERRFGLDPNTDDADLDRDGDGLSNRLELRYGARPDQADTDGDGLSDSEEVYGGADGWVTDPSRADSDGDGVTDGADPVPLDGTSTATATPPAEAIVSLSQGELVLTPDQPLGNILVSNAGTATLSWTSVVPSDSLVAVTPRAPSVVRGDGRLTVMLPPSIQRLTPELDGLGIPVRVLDVAGSTPDEQTLMVWIGQRGTARDGGTSADGGPPGGDGGAPSGDSGAIRLDGAASLDGSTGSSSDGGKSGGDGDDGCGCTVSRPRPGAGHGLFLVLLGAALIARATKRRPFRPRR